CGRIVQLCAVGNLTGIEINETRCNQDLTVWQQRCRVELAGCVEIAGDAPCSCGWIVQLRAVETAGTVGAAGNEDVPARQQRRRVVKAGYVEVASNTPRPGGRVV